MASLASQAITDDGEGILQCDGQVCKDFVTGESATRAGNTQNGRPPLPFGTHRVRFGS
jgi:hypothetical protein